MAALQGIKIINLGKSGTGKTYALRTWIECGIKPYIIFTEQGREALEDLPKDSFVGRYIPAAPVNFTKIKDGLAKIRDLSYEALTKLPPVDKVSHAQMVDLAVCCADFVDDDGVHYGDVTTWNTDRVLVIDNLSGLSRMAMNLVVGAKPTRAQNEYGVAMGAIETLLHTLCNIKAHFVLISHVEREQDELSGGTENMVSTLGKKLAPKLPSMFSDVVLARREGVKFEWTCAAIAYELKSRNFPLVDKFEPTYKIGFNTWMSRGGKVEATT